MCEFCTQHGEGKTWYLAVENYPRDLLELLNVDRLTQHAATGVHAGRLRQGGLPMLDPLLAHDFGKALNHQEVRVDNMGRQAVSSH